LSGDTFGAIVELAPVMKSISYLKISLIAEGNLSRGFSSTPMKAILEVKPVGKKAGAGYVSSITHHEIDKINSRARLGIRHNVIILKTQQIGNNY